MTLPASVRSSVLEVVQRLRDPMREVEVTSVGFLILDAMTDLRPGEGAVVLNALRLALDLPPVPGSIARWASGKSRDEVAEALEAVATSDDAGR